MHENVGNANDSGNTHGSDSYLGKTWFKPEKNLAGLGSTEDHVLRTTWVERHVKIDLGPSAPRWESYRRGSCVPHDAFCLIGLSARTKAGA